MSKSQLFKYAAIGFAGLYIYQKLKENGGRLAGNPEGVGLKPEKSSKIVDHLMVHAPIPEQFKPVVSKACKGVANHFLSPDYDIIDVTPKGKSGRAEP